MRSFAVSRTLLNIVAVSIAFIATSATSVDAKSACKFKHHDIGYTGSIVVNGTPERVFGAIKESRHTDKRKVLSSKGNSVLLEETFFKLPIIGDAKCKYREIEVPHKRIDYEIVHSKQFKKFEGKWELCPVNGGKATLVKLTSIVEAYLKVPFARQLTDHNTKKDIKRRLVDIRKRVELNDKRQISYAQK